MALEAFDQLALPRILGTRSLWGRPNQADELPMTERLAAAPPTATIVGRKRVGSTSPRAPPDR